MAYAFSEKPVATIKAKITGTVDSVTIPGTNPNSTPGNAKTQIDKILDVVGGKTVDIEGMTRTRTSEVTDNG